MASSGDDHDEEESPRKYEWRKDDRTVSDLPAQFRMTREVESLQLDKPRQEPCDANPFSSQNKKQVRSRGIEPRTNPWEGSMMPLHHDRSSR